MLVVGLTGGIASGKSTVSGMLARAGAVIVDADEAAREVVRPGLPAWLEIRKVFGDGVINLDGTIDRRKLGDIVFQDAALRARLEAIVHPRVGACMADRIERVRRFQPDALVVMDVPLLLEAGMHEGLAEIIVVYVPEELQLKRLMQRDGISLRQAQARIAAQMPMEAKRRAATIVIDNSGDIGRTEEQALRIYRRLSQRAARPRPDPFFD